MRTIILPVNTRHYEDNNITSKILDTMRTIILPVNTRHYEDNNNTSKY